MVDDQMVRGVHDFTVHFDTFAVFFSNGVAILIRTFGEPCILAQPRVVFGVDDGELSAGQRNPSRRAACCAGGSRRIEAGTPAAKRADIPSAFGAFFLSAYKGCPSGASGKGRKTAVITSGLCCPAFFFAGHKICSPASKMNCFITPFCGDIIP